MTQNLSVHFHSALGGSQSVSRGEQRSQEKQPIAASSQGISVSLWELMFSQVEDFKIKVELL